MSLARSELTFVAAIGCTWCDAMCDHDLGLASPPKYDLCGSGEGRRAEMFARSLLTGLRDEDGDEDGDDEDEDEDGDEEVMKLDAEGSREQPAMQNFEWLEIWRDPIVGRI